MPLWSYTSHGHWNQIFQNIALFVPLGFFLSSTFSSSKRPVLWPILSALLVSVAVEVTQFFTYRGMLDVDDLISNCCGAAAGMLIYKAVGKLSRDDVWKWTGRVMLTAGLIGCIMVAVPAAKSNISTRITEQFWFSVSSVTLNDKLSTAGECFLYDRTTPDYTIFVGGAPATTVVEGEKFIAEAEASGKAEVQVKFRGFPVMPTGVWINGERIEYVAGEVPVIKGLPEGAVLKAWNEEYDTLVYQDGERLLWLIGTEIDKSTEVIYHIHTTQPEFLPEKRVQYGFDNRGFRVGAERAENELEPIDHYRVFERGIPEGYNVTAIVVGFNTDGAISWNDSFRIE